MPGPLFSELDFGSDDGTDEPGKPNGMHWTTYNRLLDQMPSNL